MVEEIEIRDYLNPRGLVAVELEVRVDEMPCTIPNVYARDLWRLDLDHGFEPLAYTVVRVSLGDYKPRSSAHGAPPLVRLRW